MHPQRRRAFFSVRLFCPLHVFSTRQSGRECSKNEMKRRREDSESTTPSGPAPPTAEGRVSALRSLMRNLELDAYIVHSEDPHMSEYVATCHERRAFISGFTGSAGLAVVTQSEALVWTDGRYFVQAKNELAKEGDVFKLMKLSIDPMVDDWLAKNIKDKGRVGFDPSTVSLQRALKLKSVFKSSGKDIVMAPLDHTIVNLVDQVWGESRPSSPRSTVFMLEDKYTGESAEAKIGRMRKQMESNGLTHLVVSALDEVAWLFNLRGSDVDYNPVFWSYALLTNDSTTLYVDSSRFEKGVEAYLAKQNVKVFPYESFFKDLGTIAKGAKVWIDPSTCNYLIYTQLDSCSKAENVVQKPSPVALAKAKKNETELQGIREAHLRDGVALVKYLCWLEKQVTSGKEPTECEGADKLDGLRSQQANFVSLSFPTISGTGPNGAIIHYRAKKETCAKIVANQVYLVDSGGQYRDGTTDVTRTLHFGTPTKWEKECYTRVLRGHIAVDTAVFPSGTAGNLIDSFARRPLWECGLDYKHGTGHGVGCFLNVHEGPHMISYKRVAQATPFEPGFLVSNEPGYYEEGAFGIRIENVLEVVPLKQSEKSDRPFYTFKSLTVAPIQTKMIKMDALSPKERAWVQVYNRECLKKLTPFLEDDPETLKWLQMNTQV